MRTPRNEARLHGNGALWDLTAGLHPLIIDKLEWVSGSRGPRSARANNVYRR